MKRLLELSMLPSCGTQIPVNILGMEVSDTSVSGTTCGALATASDADGPERQCHPRNA